MRLAHLPKLTLITCSLLAGACGYVAEPWDDPSAEHSDENASQHRATAVVQTLVEWNKDLLPQDRVAKYCNMSGSEFVFYRGSNHLFWDDYAMDARLQIFGNEKTRVWLQGDLHAFNFGAFSNDEGAVVYTLNDFDEAIIADYQYDVWRMAISLYLLARGSGILDDKSIDSMVRLFAKEYRHTMTSYRGNNDEGNIEFTVNNLRKPLATLLEKVEKKKSRARALKKWTTIENEQRTFNLSLPKLSPASEQEAQILAAMPAYRESLSGGRRDADYYRIKSIARRLLAGTGSLGTPRYYVLVEGPSDSLDDDRILDVKRQAKPTAYHFLEQETRNSYDALFVNDAQRHAIGYKALLSDVDNRLGWMLLADGAYSVRERSVYKDSIELADFETQKHFDSAAKDWGMILATTHARSDQDFDKSMIPFSVDKQIDEVTSGQGAAFDQLVVEVAQEYANQVRSDWAAFRKALEPQVCPAE